MNTTFLLLAEYNTVDIPLEVVAQKYLGLDERTAKMRAARGELPFPVYRTSGQKSPWLVRTTDLAAYLDAARAKATQDWHKRQSASA